MTKEREFISPEGVEERVLREAIFMVTLTGGGKYRLYQRTANNAEVTNFQSMGVFDTVKEANEMAGRVMITFGSLLADPLKLIAALEQLLQKPEDE